MSEFKDLKKDFDEHKKFVLFLGAGVNMSSGLYDMSWNMLMGKLFKEILNTCCEENNLSQEKKMIEQFASDFKDEQCPRELLKSREFFRTTFNSLVQATIVKQIMGDSYIPSIQDKIYRKDDKYFTKSEFFKILHNSYPVKNYENVGQFFTLFCLAVMILLCDNIKAVVTYNYDNFLTKTVEVLHEDPKTFFGEGFEKYYRLKTGNNFEIKDITDPKDGQSLKEGVLPVYHVHGYIPDNSEIKPKDGGGIVLSMDEIYETTRDVFSWQTSTQLYFLSNYACILSGISFNDVTTQRLLYYVNKTGHREKIYYLDAFSNTGNKDSANAEKAFMKIRNSFLRKYGLTVLYEESGFTKLFQNVLKCAIRPDEFRQIFPLALQKPCCTMLQWWIDLLQCPVNA